MKHVSKIIMMIMFMIMIMLCLRSDSSLAVGLATRLGDPTQSVLAPHR